MKMIAGKEDYSSSWSKSAQIRNPAICYVHKALASTFFAKKVTKNMNENELQMMDIAFKDILNSTSNEGFFQGDGLDTRLSIVILDQFLNYRE